MRATPEGVNSKLWTFMAQRERLHSLTSGEPTWIHRWTSKGQPVRYWRWGFPALSSCNGRRDPSRHALHGLVGPVAERADLAGRGGDAAPAGWNAHAGSAPKFRADVRRKS